MNVRHITGEFGNNLTFIYSRTSLQRPHSERIFCRCKEVAVMASFSITRFHSMYQNSGQEDMNVEERWPLWGGGW